MRDSKQLGYGILFLIFIFGIWLIVDSGGDGTIILFGILLMFIGSSPLWYFMYESWKEENP